ncbi:MAG: hypothetical protein ACHP7F_01855, partial [Actinomycetales bacterium]
IKDSQSTPPEYWFGVIEHNRRGRMRAELAELGLRRSTWQILHALADGSTSVEDIAAKLPFGRDGKRGRGAGFDRGAFGRGAFGRPRFSTEAEREAFFERMHERHHEGRPGPQHHGHAHDHTHAHDHDHDHAHAHAYDHHHAHQWARGADERCAPHWEHGDRRARRVDEVLDAFAERGWVTFHDGTAELTEAGREAHEVASGRIQTLRASATEGISDADYATTIATLEAMARNLGTTKTTPKGPDSDSDSSPTP